MAAIRDEATEVLAIVDRIGPVVLSAAVNPRGAIGASLRRAVGMLVADPNMVNLQAFTYAFMVCLDLARQAEATLITMDRVRKAALEEKPESLPALQTVLAIVRLTLVTQTRIIAYMEFRSREVVDQIVTAVNEVFNQTTEIAADDLDQGTYMALINLHGATIAHLTARGRQLPRVINYHYPMVMPSLRMAQRAYNDPTRHQEIVDENKIVHPAFCPQDGRMLSSLGAT